MTYGQKRRKEIASRMRNTKSFFPETMNDMGGNRGSKNAAGKVGVAKNVRSLSK